MVLLCVVPRSPLDARAWAAYTTILAEPMCSNTGGSTHSLEVHPHMLQVQRRCVADAWPSFSHPDLADPSLVLRCGLSSQMRQPAIPRFTLVELGADTGRIGAIPRLRLSPLDMVETNRWTVLPQLDCLRGRVVFLCSVLMAVFLLPVYMACKKTRHVNCSRTVAALQATAQYSQATRCSTRFALLLAQGARQNGVQETWRLVPAAEKSGPLQRRRIPWHFN